MSAPGCGGTRWRRLTHVDEAAGVVERAEVRAAEAEEGVQLVDQRRHARPRQRRADDQVAQRVTNETAAHTQRDVTCKQSHVLDPAQLVHSKTQLWAVRTMSCT